MSEAMETQADNAIIQSTEPLESNSPKKSPEENATIPDDITPAEEITLLNDLASPPLENDQTEDSPLITNSAPLEESITPIVDLSGADTAVGQVAASPAIITADQCLSHSKTISETVPFNREEVVSDSRANALWIVCQVCKSKILQPNIGVYVESEAELPPLLKKESLNAATQEIPVEKVTAFWKIKDMFHFENIGVSKTIGNTKYLLCADCEIGPVGYHLITNPQAFFLAVHRVVYADNV
ncbi:Guanine nucleotide exchange factor MSS4 [Oopsacas minuta]|uniref:Guanine nucleotide exchange factor MSS4 n=1 Tax=Oopsacas minuta TaxID=111878 RepID=A0AAV7JS75_9METZ|nr:Guanine nucleotide exchange factor MSS4 [Oopsacas minuta]